jgi:hypothetical protein
MSTSSEVEAGETADHAWRTEQTPLGYLRTDLPRHSQPFTPPIPSKHQCATQPILQIADQLQLLMPAMSRGILPPE